MDDVGFPASPTQMGKDGPILRQAANPSPNSPTVRYVFIEGEGTFSPGLGPGSRRKILSPGNNQEAPDVAAACSACCPRAFGPCDCACPGRRSTRSPRPSDTRGNELWPGAGCSYGMTSGCLISLNTSGHHQTTGHPMSPSHSRAPSHFPK